MDYNLKTIPKEVYEFSSLFEVEDEIYLNLERKRLKSQRAKIKNTGSYELKNDTRTEKGDGIPELVGYNLSSVWSKLTHLNSEFYPYSIPLPKQKRSNLAVSYSRTNLLSIERIIKTYLRNNDRFLENCCGWSTFGTMAAYYGYDGVGVDIWDVALETSKRQYEIIKNLPRVGSYEIIEADGMALPFNDESFDYVYCNPPFLDMELYSGKQNDVADSDFSKFLLKLKRIISENFRTLKAGGLCTMTINDKREKGILIPMQKHLIDLALEVGFKLHDFVISEGITGAALIVRKREYNKRRTAKMHEYVITFIKQ